jgi:hypothetical protein
MQVFAIGGDGSLYSEWSDGAGAWQPWRDFVNPGVPLTGSPVAIAFGDTFSGHGRLQVFAIGGDGSLYNEWSDDAGAWQPWRDIVNPGVPLTGSPAATLSYEPDSGWLQVFAIGGDGSLYDEWYDVAGAWRPWRGFGNPGVPLTGSPAAAAASFAMSAPATVTSGVAFTTQVTALDPYGNSDTDDAGTVTFTSTDGAAQLPDAYAFQPGDAGVASFTVTLSTPGDQMITATDTAANSLTGTALASVMPPGVPGASGRRRDPWAGVAVAEAVLDEFSLGEPRRALVPPGVHG